MASLFIKDSETAAAAKRLALRLGTTKTEVVRRGLRALEEQVGEDRSGSDFAARMAAYRRAHPLPPVDGRAPDKAFYDWLSGEEDDGGDAVR